MKAEDAAEELSRVLCQELRSYGCRWDAERGTFVKGRAGGAYRVRPMLEVMPAFREAEDAGHDGQQIVALVLARLKRMLGGAEPPPGPPREPKKQWWRPEPEPGDGWHRHPEPPRPPVDPESTLA